MITQGGVHLLFYSIAWPGGRAWEGSENGQICAILLMAGPLVPVHKMVKMIHEGNVVVVSFKGDIWVNILQCADGCIHLGEPSLVRLKKQTIHVGQFNLKIKLRQKYIFSNADLCYCPETMWKASLNRPHSKIYIITQ